MPTTIAVTGHAEERIAPELGAVTLSVGGSGAARDDVYGRTSAAHERLLAAVRELEASGVTREVVGGPAAGLVVPPVEQRGPAAAGRAPGERRRRGRLPRPRAPRRVGRRHGRADELTVGGIDWRLTDATRRRVQETAQRAAVADAVAKAQVYASALGLGTPVPVELADHGMLSSQPTPSRRP